MNSNAELEAMTKHVIEVLTEINVMLRAGDAALAKKAVTGLIKLLKSDEPWAREETKRP